MRPAPSLLVVPLLTLILLGSCNFPRATDGGFDSPNPAARMYAVERAVRAGDYGAVRHIIEQLDSDDPALRLMAIEALHRLTGRTYGYHHYDPKWDREEAIERWVQAYQSGQLHERLDREMSARMTEEETTRHD